MKAFTCTSFIGFYRAGTAAVVIADNQEDAADMLNGKLKAEGLKADAEAKDMIEFPANERESVRILCNGDY